MLKKIQQFFQLDDGTDLSRRKFIKDAATLTALAVTATTSPRLAQQLFESIEKQIASGVVEGKTFWLTEPVVIDLPNVIIRNCLFIAVNPMPYMLQFTSRAKDCRMTGCVMDTNGQAVGYCIEVLPQGETNMATTLQSAVDFAASSGKPLMLKEGTYKTQPIIKWPT